MLFDCQMAYLRPPHISHLASWQLAHMLAQRLHLGYALHLLGAVQKRLVDADLGQARRVHQKEGAVLELPSNRNRVTGS